MYKRRWSPERPTWVGAVQIGPLVVVLALFVLYPLVELISASLREHGIAQYAAYFRSRANVRALVFTLWESSVVTILAVVLGGVLGWSLRTARSRAGKIVLWAAVLVPLWMGVVIKNYAFMIILGRNGIVNIVLQMLGATHGPIDLLYTPSAVIIGMLYTMLPYAVLPLYVTFLSIDMDLVAAAESLGASRLRAMMSVVLPLSAPGFLGTTVLVFVISIGFYVTPVVLGGSKGTFVSTLVQDDLFFRFDYAAAATSGALLVGVAAIVLSLALLLVGRRRLERAIA